MSERHKRMRNRITLAGWHKDVRRNDFIRNYLERRKIDVKNNLCISSPTFYIVKDIEPIAQGAVGLVWGCSRCMGGQRAINQLFEELSPSPQLPKKLPQFPGFCGVHRQEKSDTNTLIIIPTLNEKIKKNCPFMCQTQNEQLKVGNDILERTTFLI